jgi:regulator of sirC expression with transglutaminase-like and TPR domain
VDESRIRVRSSFAALITRPSDAIPLADAALLIAAEEYPDLDVREYLALLDTLADGVREQVDNAEDNRAAGAILARYLFDDQGFRGNEADYYDPRNSFLNQVLDRRIGIPITLSILYMEIAARLGLRVHGIGIPGHFLVRLAEAGTYVDPFTGQVDLTDADCAERVRSLYGGRLQFDRSMLSVQSHRQILVRILRNLREIYHGREDRLRELGALDRLVLLSPQDPQVLRERADVLGKLGEYRRALRDLQEVRRLQPALRRSSRFRGWRRLVEEMASRMN